MKDKMINRPLQITHADYHQAGYGLKSVRISHRSFKGEVGFATVSYSSNMTNEMQSYSAERISLALRYLKGLSNDDIKVLIARREAKG